LLGIAGSKIAILETNTHSNSSEVFNLTVANDHTYFVGIDGVLVHNSQKGCNVSGILVGATKGTQFRHTKHNGGPGKKPGKKPGKIASREPSDSEYVYQKRAIKAENNVWYGQADDGNIYRYFEDSGRVHWSGSTGKGKGAIRSADIPNAVKKHFGFKSRGKR